VAAAHPRGGPAVRTAGPHVGDGGRPVHLHPLLTLVPEGMGSNRMALRETTLAAAPETPAAAAPAPTAPRWTLPALTRLLLLGVSAVLALAAAEGGLRVLGIDSPRVWEPDPQLGWHHVPGARKHWTAEGSGLIVVNSQGFRDRERSAEKPAGTHR